jgi:uncharacterized delta-60 repeat protein
MTRFSFAIACLVAITIRGATAPGSLDATFDAGTLGAVLAIAVQTDSKILIGGHFTTIDGTPRGHIARIEANGALDSTFDPGAGADGFVRAVLVQKDRSVLMAGNFVNVNGIHRGGIARLKSGGGLDASFDSSSGANDQVTAMALQTDGKIAISGYFTEFAGVPRNYLARLNPDGSLDASFDPGDAAGDNVYAIAIQPDGKILAAGYFFWNQRVSSLVRLNTDGARDESFAAGTLVSEINSLCLDNDGKILVGSSGNYNKDTARLENCIVRLNADGSLDATFNVGAGPDDYVECVAVQASGKILIGGNFTQVNTTPRRYLARLNADGSLDSDFDTGAVFNQWIGSIALQTNGFILAGGNSARSWGAARNSIARLAGDPILPPSAGRLGIRRIPGGMLLLSWSASARDFVLETREGWGVSQSWRAAPGAAVVDSEACWWTNRSIGAKSFFRLRQP